MQGKTRVDISPVFCPANHPSPSSLPLPGGQEDEGEMIRDLLLQTLVAKGKRANCTWRGALFFGERLPRDSFFHGQLRDLHSLFSGRLRTPGGRRRADHARALLA